MTPPPDTRWHWVLTAAFAGRVLGQPLALVVEPGVLPSFDAWDGGVLPYPALLAAQLAILGWMAATTVSMARQRLTPRPLLGRGVLVCAGVYFAGSLLRLVLGATVLSSSRWFASPMPTFFHLVLATYLLLYGRYHTRGAR